MKIVCGSCGAKYSIADEKVQGKVFKIRCRKCSNVIVVKGSADGSSVEHLSAADAAESMSSDFGGTASASEWYVVIDGEQAGPMTPDEIEAQFASGRITAESFVWRDGMGDWSVLRDVEIFRHLGAQREEEATHVVESPLRAAQRPVEEDPDGATAVVDGGLVRAAMEANQGASAYDSFGGFGSSQPMAAAPQPAALHSPAAPAAGGFAASFGGGLGMNSYDEPANNNDGLFASLDKGNDGGMAYQSFAGIGSSSSFGGLDLGGSGAATASVRPAESARPSAASVASSGGAGAPELISTRNENSVLFSLSSLQKVEAVKADAGKDVPVTEGSGLIDIKSLATTHQAMKSGGPRDEAPVDVFAPGTMSMPAIMPRGSHRNNNNLIIAVGVLGVLGIAAIVGVGYVLSNKESEPKVIEKVIVEKAAEPAKTAGMSKEEVEAMLAEERLKMAAANANANKPAEGGGEEAGSKDDGKSPKKPGDKKAGDKVAAKPDDKPAEDKPAEDKPKTDKKKSGDGIDDLMKGLDEKKDAKKDDPKKAVAAVKEKEPEPAAQEKLSKSDVQNTINKYAARVDDCASSSNKGGLKGTMFVKFSVEPSGTVSSPAVDSANFKGTDVGECVSKVVKSMKFPASQQGIPSIKYPFILR